MNIEEKLKELEEKEKELQEDIFFLETFHPECFPEFFEEILKISKKIDLGCEYEKAKESNALFDFISELIDEVEKGLKELKEEKEGFKKIKEKLDKNRLYIIEELDALQSENFEEALRFYEGYEFFEDEEEKKETRKIEIERRKNWLDCTEPILRLVRPGNNNFDLFPFRDVKEVQRFRYYFADLYLNGSVYKESVYSNRWISADEILELFGEIEF